MGCETHQAHPHRHGAGCGHHTVEHDGHTDYLHEGHMHNVHGDHVDEHRVEVGAGNPESCTPSHSCAEHARGHQHGAGCGHESVPHGDHVDYAVGTHLHHPHGAHCDDHGPLKTA
jgi:hypothetical protein